MIKLTYKSYPSVFWLLVCINLAAIALHLSFLFFITKILLVPALAVILSSTLSGTKDNKIIRTALFFSWLGDLFLLFESRDPLFFIGGLSSFLIAHICYIICFLSFKSVAPSFLRKHPLFILLVLSYGGCLVWLLSPNLGQLKIPVIIYAAVICSMLLCSIHIYLKVKKPANNYYVAGAALFVLSDSILAINKFYTPLPMASIVIMASYCAAQYFIVMGYIKMKYL